MKMKLLILMIYIPVLFASALIHKALPVFHVSPEKLAIALKPILKSGESITVFNNNLIVNVSPDTLSQIRVVMHQLDVTPTIFVISVHQGSDAQFDSNMQNGEIYSTDDNKDQIKNQSIQIESGSSAFIAVGQDSAVLSQVNGENLNNGAGVSYERVHTQNGFYIKPELQGDKVRIVLKKFNSAPNKINQQDIDTQNIETTTMVDLDKWVKISGNDIANTNFSAKSVTYQAGGGRQQTKELYIKVSKAKD